MEISTKSAKTPLRFYTTCPGPLYPRCPPRLACFAIARVDGGGCTRPAPAARARGPMNFLTREFVPVLPAGPPGVQQALSNSTIRDNILPQRSPAYEYARIRASHTLRQCAERSLFVVGATPHDPWRRPGRLVGASGAISVSTKNRPRGPVRALSSHGRITDESATTDLATIDAVVRAPWFRDASGV